MKLKCRTQDRQAECKQIDLHTHRSISHSVEWKWERERERGKAEPEGGPHFDFKLKLIIIMSLSGLPAVIIHCFRTLALEHSYWTERRQAIIFGDCQFPNDDYFWAISAIHQLQQCQLQQRNWHPFSLLSSIQTKHFPLCTIKFCAHIYDWLH